MDGRHPFAYLLVLSRCVSTKALKNVWHTILQFTTWLHINQPLSNDIKQNIFSTYEMDGCLLEINLNAIVIATGRGIP